MIKNQECLLQIRIVARLIEEDEAGADCRLFDFLESMLRHKAEMVIYEAANAIVTLRKSSARDLAPAISVLQLFLSSPKPTLRWDLGWNFSVKWSVDNRNLMSFIVHFLKKKIMPSAVS